MDEVWKLRILQVDVLIGTVVLNATKNINVKKGAELSGAWIVWDWEVC